MQPEPAFDEAPAPGLVEVVRRSLEARSAGAVGEPAVLAQGAAALAEAVALFVTHADDRPEFVAAGEALAQALDAWGGRRSAAEIRAATAAVAARLGLGPLRVEPVERDPIDLRRDALVTALVSMARRAPAPVATALQVDPVTGLPQRERLGAHLDGLSGRIGSIAVVVFDVDRFGEVDGRFGRTVAHEVLRRVARLVEGLVRTGDLAARLGADEFVAVLGLPTGEGCDAAAEAAERVRAAVAAHPWDAVAAGLEVTVSAGVAAGPAASGRALLRAAHDGCHQAKRTGRNRVVAAT
ncbi:MAG: GGDEF domain-containing protein [Acidimicrobiales bacterium]